HWPTSGLLTSLDRVQVDQINLASVNWHQAFYKPSASTGLNSDLMRLSSLCTSESAAIADSSASQVSRLPAKPARTRCTSLSSRLNCSSVGSCANWLSISLRADVAILL